MLTIFLNRRRSRVQAGFTLIELVVVLAVLGILLALAIPRYLGVRKRAYKEEIINILQEAKTLSWAYYQEFDVFPTMITDIGLQMPSGTVWAVPGPSGGGTGSFIQWTSSGTGSPMVSTDACSVTVTVDGAASQGCNF